MRTEPCRECGGAPVPVESRAAHAALHAQIRVLEERLAVLEATAQRAGDVWRSVAAA